MYVTLETDYAIRIVDCIARANRRMGAKEVSEKASVSLRFSLKILRKLVAVGIVNSFKGSQGGYEIGRKMDEISVNDILEAIEGEYILNRCLKEDSTCLKAVDKECPYRDLFDEISKDVQNKLKSAKLSTIIN